MRTNQKTIAPKIPVMRGAAAHETKIRATVPLVVALDDIRTHVRYAECAQTFKYAALA